MHLEVSRLPLRRLVVFEAAARHGRFVAAAQELAMSQAAVSQHVGLLEAELGFAAWWLMPRIARLSGVAPDVELRLITTQSDNLADDPEFDLAILFGAGAWPGYRAERLFQEEIYPVCAPTYLGERPVPAPAEISRMRLLHLSGPSAQRWFTWNDWFSAMKLPPVSRAHDLTFNNYQLLLQAALQGQGVGLGWAPLIDTLVESRVLVRLSDTPLTSGRGYFVVEGRDSPVSDHREAFKRLLFAPPPGHEGEPAS